MIDGHMGTASQSMNSHTWLYGSSEIREDDLLLVVTSPVYSTYKH